MATEAAVTEKQLIHYRNENGVAVIDRGGRVRLTHEGYNAADVNFREDLERFAGGL